MQLVRDQDYFFCQYCGAFHFPAPNDEGVRLLDALPYPQDCPVCQEPLYRASINHYPAMHCKKCRGTLMHQYLFGEIVPYLRSRAGGPTDKPRLLDQAQLNRRVRCPQCYEVMETHPYAGPGNIVIDTCPHCHIIWLDYGEINRVINAPGSDRGRPWYVDNEDIEEG
jgi:Zn-finger nucleic acid-binding protein